MYIQRHESSRHAFEHDRRELEQLSTRSDDEVDHFDKETRSNTKKDARRRTRRSVMYSSNTASSTR